MDKSSIREAIAYFTGNAFKPSPNPQWTDLQNRILKQGHSPWQFCYFIVHCHPTNKQGSGALKFLSWLLKDEVHREFKNWIEELPEEARWIVQAQMEHLEAYRKLNIDMLPILMSDHDDYSALVRIEMALNYLKDPSPVCKKYLPTADYILKGCPVYGELCPLAAAYLERHPL